mgnify:CR=1 FL=1
MKYSIFLLLSLLFSISKSDLRDQLLLFKEEVLTEHEQILKFWENYTIDEENGGFIGQIDSDMTKHSDADKGVILNARITWSFSAAYKYTNKTEYLKFYEVTANAVGKKIFKKIVKKHIEGPEFRIFLNI